MALSATYNRILNIAENFGTRHAQIRKFAIGDNPEDIGEDKGINGMYMLFNISSTYARAGSVYYSLAAMIIDVAGRKGAKKNSRQPRITNVLNDTFLVALDFVTFWKGSGLGAVDTNCLELFEESVLQESTIQIQPVRHAGHNDYTGMLVSFDVQVPFNYDRSALPLDVSGGSPVPSDTINITVQDAASTLIEVFNNLTPITQTIALSNAYLIGSDGIQVVNEGDGEIAIIQVA